MFGLLKFTICATRCHCIIRINQFELFSSIIEAFKPEKLNFKLGLHTEMYVSQVAFCVRVCTYVRVQPELTGY